MHNAAMVNKSKRVKKSEKFDFSPYIVYHAKFGSSLAYTGYQVMITSRVLFFVLCALTYFLACKQNPAES